MWKQYAKKGDFYGLGQKFNVDPLVIRVLINRDIKDEKDIRLFFGGKLSDMAPPSLLPDIKTACDIIADKISQNKSICIVGDYDIDGVCATFILVDALKKLNANVSFVIPDRVKDGYGINKSIIDGAIKDKVDTIITCDNGIAASPEIEYAAENNITVIVTDHHDVASLPLKAKAIVDAKRDDNKYPFNALCGAVIALKFVEELYKTMNKDLSSNGEVIERKENSIAYGGNVFYYYLEFATFATIGDMVPLISENHIIAKEGLKKINACCSFKKNNKIPFNKGIRKLIEISGLLEMKITEFHIGFILGPQINASGRLASAYTAVKLFLTDDEAERLKYAMELKSLNDERKEITEKNAKICNSLCEEKYKDDKVLVMYCEDLHESVAGIVAGKIKEGFNKPTLVLTDTIDDEIAKGSARSIEQYNMFEELSKVKDIFIKFGGHKGAAGFSLYKNKIDELRERLNEQCELTDTDFEKITWIDSELPFDYITEKLINDLDMLKPYGSVVTYFPAPSFGAKNLTIKSVKLYGERKNVVKMVLFGYGKSFPAIYFTNGEEFVNNLNMASYGKEQNMDSEDKGIPSNENNTNNKYPLARIIFTPIFNEFMGDKNIELKISEFELQN